jgi:Delta7-sterol 5-desaturase
MWLLCVGVSVLVSLVSFGGVGGLVHWWFYVHRRAEARRWKLQPDRWLSPALTRHALVLGAANIVLGAVVGGTLAWWVGRGGWSMLYFDARRHGLAYLPVSAALVFLLVDAGLYYSHRLLHHRLLFRHVHRWHHRYVAPILFTTTAVHPLEFLFFEAFLVLPAFVVPVHVGVYLAVVAYTYLVGMIDHSGVRVRWPLPLHGDNRFHDDHHVYFHCNYAHHTPIFDRLHGTVRRPDRHYDEHTFGGHGRAP